MAERKTVGKYSIQMTIEAARDIEDFLRHAEFSEAAVQFAEYLSTDRLRLLSNFPKIFPAVEGFVGVRKISEPPFLIFYKINEAEKTIRVLRYWHGAREGKPFLS